MFYLFGLGNPGEKYEQTPHNIGKTYASYYMSENKDSLSSPRDVRNKYKISKGVFCEECLSVIYPTGTYMNSSGDCTLDIDHEDRRNLIVIYDDIDLAVGEIKISFNRGDGGHNGIRDIVKKMRTKEFTRIRVGVCPLDFFGKKRKPKGHAAINRYLVDKKLSKRSSMVFQDKVFTKIDQAIDEILKNGSQSAMNKFN